MFKFCTDCGKTGVLHLTAVTLSLLWAVIPQSNSSKIYPEITRKNVEAFSQRPLSVHSLSISRCFKHAGRQHIWAALPCCSMFIALSICWCLLSTKRPPRASHLPSRKTIHMHFKSTTFLLTALKGIKQRYDATGKRSLKFLMSWSFHGNMFYFYFTDIKTDTRH